MWLDHEWCYSIGDSWLKGNDLLQFKLIVFSTQLKWFALTFSYMGGIMLIQYSMWIITPIFKSWINIFKNAMDFSMLITSLGHISHLSLDCTIPYISPAPHRPSHCQTQEEGSGTAQGWVGLLWLTRRHWPVWQPDKLTLCLNWPCGIIPRQLASPIGSSHMMLGDSHRPFYHGKEWMQSIHGHRWSAYDNVWSCWICKYRVNLGQQSKSQYFHVSQCILMNISSKGRVLLGEKHQSCYQWQQTFRKRKGLK